MIATGEVDGENFTVVAAGELAYVGARRGEWQTQGPAVVVGLALDLAYQNHIRHWH